MTKAEVLQLARAYRTRCIELLQAPDKNFLSEVKSLKIPSLGAIEATHRQGIINLNLSRENYAPGQSLLLFANLTEEERVKLRQGKFPKGIELFISVEGLQDTRSKQDKHGFMSLFTDKSKSIKQVITPIFIDVHCLERRDKRIFVSERFPITRQNEIWKLNEDDALKRKIFLESGKPHPTFLILSLGYLLGDIKGFIPENEPFDWRSSGFNSFYKTVLDKFAEYILAPQKTEMEPDIFRYAKLWFMQELIIPQHEFSIAYNQVVTKYNEHLNKMTPEDKESCLENQELGSYSIINNNLANIFHINISVVKTARRLFDAQQSQKNEEAPHANIS